MALTQTVSPSTEPISLADARAQLRKVDIREDAYIAGVLIPAARDRAELATNRQLVTATWELTLDAWPEAGWIDVPRAPLQSVVSIQYLDASGVLQTMSSSDYVVDAPAGPRAARGRIGLAYGRAWPSTQSVLNAITVTFVAGYGAASAVPPQLRMAMLRDVASMFEHREDVVVGTISSQLPRSSSSVYRSYRIHPLQRVS